MRCTLKTMNVSVQLPNANEFSQILTHLLDSNRNKSDNLKSYYIKRP